MSPPSSWSHWFQMGSPMSLELMLFCRDCVIPFGFFKDSFPCKDFSCAISYYGFLWVMLLSVSQLLGSAGLCFFFFFSLPNLDVFHHHFLNTFSVSLLSWDTSDMNLNSFVPQAPGTLLTLFSDYFHCCPDWANSIDPNHILCHCCYRGHLMRFLFLFLFFGDTGASHLLGRCSITWATLPAFFCFGYYWSRVSQTISLSWLQISASLVARIIDMSPCPPPPYGFYFWCFIYSSVICTFVWLLVLCWEFLFFSFVSRAHRSTFRMVALRSFLGNSSLVR
jgi:hypothetical protein